MRARHILALCLASCNSGKPIPSEQAPAQALTAVADAMVAAPMKPVDLGVVGGASRYTPGVRMLLLRGEHVYWSTLGDDGTLTVRRIPRAGGSIEVLASFQNAGGAVQGHRNMALLGSDLIIIGASATSNIAQSRAPLFKIQNATPREFTRGPIRTVGSTGLVAHDGMLYWTAAGPTGSGPVMETTAAGVTRTILCEKTGPFGCEHHLLDGLPPIATDTVSMWKLGPQAIKLPAACAECTEPTTVVAGDHVLCIPTPAADAPGATCKPVPTLVKLDGSRRELPGIGAGLQRADGRYYHIPNDDLVRRAALDGPDQTFASKAEMFAADDRGVVWVGHDEHLWSAPH